MWTCYRPKGDAAYILFADVHPGVAAVKFVEVVPFETALQPSMRASLERLTLELDCDGRLIGIQVAEASRVLPKGFLDAAAAQANSPMPKVFK